MALSWSALPAAVGIVFAAGIVTTYIIAVCVGHVDAIFPYIRFVCIN